MQVIVPGGGAVQSDGRVRTDAGVMTDDRSAGAVCSLPGVEHAVTAARVVCEETPHVLVSGEHAVESAADFGVETGVDPWSDRIRQPSAEVEEGGCDGEGARGIAGPDFWTSDWWHSERATSRLLCSLPRHFSPGRTTASS